MKRTVKLMSFAFLLNVIVWLLFLTGCDHRDIRYDSPARFVPVMVEFDWDKCPSASPAGMTVYFFRVDNETRKGSGSPYVFDIKGSNGGKISLPPGRYAALCHNSDSDTHSLIGEDAHEAFGLRLSDVRSGSLSSRLLNIAKNSTDERIAYSPDVVWISSIPMVEVMRNDDISITQVDENGRQAIQTIRFPMAEVTHHYYFIVHHPIHLTGSMSVTATISGMASTVHPGLWMTGTETVTHAFDMTANDSGKLTGHILTFGHCAEKEIETRQPDSGDKIHYFVLSAMHPNGKITTFTKDVTDQIHTNGNSDCVVEVDTIIFPENVSSGGGFNPSVGGWTGNQETIGM
ncbi:MAG: DUF5119 domain-containing protein [Bacteroides sp.]|nr:DUF5119 domain-containing protein [Bacteroides sp.]